MLSTFAVRKYLEKESARRSNHLSSKKISLLALFIALSVVGASIKIPAIVGSVALDVFPALLAGAILGGGLGAIVGAAGHLVSALIGGMPLGPMHFLIALEMAVLVYLFGVYFSLGKKFRASFLFVIGNAIIAPIPFLFLMGTGFYMAIVPSLLMASLLNACIALFAIPRLQALRSQTVQEGESK